MKKISSFSIRTTLLGLALVGASLPILAASALDQNWPQWRGPWQNGVAPSANPPVTWSETNNVKWKAKIPGGGSATPIVWNDRIFIQTAIPTGKKIESKQAQEQPTTGQPGAGPAHVPGGPGEQGKGGRRGFGGPKPDEVYQFAVLCLERATGKTLWQQVAREEVPHEGYRQNEGSFASSSGLTDGKHFYAYFGSRGVYCYDFAGKLAWSQDLGKMRVAMSFGEGSSPTLYKDTIIVLCDHTPKSYLLALDKSTGKERWKADRGVGRVSHCTPLVVEGPKGDELIINSSDRVDAYDPVDGKILWYTGSQRQTPVPSPVFHNGVIYLSRGYRNSDFLALRAGGRGEIKASSYLWHVASGASYVPSILYYNGLIYVTNEVGIATCVEAETGKQVWRQRLGGLFFASPTAGDGKIYLVSETGETFVLGAGREPVILARNILDERIIASPAISNGRLFLRSDGSLFCIKQPRGHAQ